jgi:hypothetical protein
MNDLVDRAHALLEEQTRSWEMLAKNRALLAKMEIRAFDFGEFTVKTQWNPARLYSVSAKVDEASIRNRKCFLCDENRPPQQHSLDCGNDYKLLCNPYPILAEHFTIVHKKHQPQRIARSFAEMLELTEMLGSHYTIFYNGPECGASAPDHLHFQAGNIGAAPLDREYDHVKKSVAIRGEVEIFFCGEYLRPFVSLESRNRQAAVDAFARIYDEYGKIVPSAVEPKVNVFCNRAGDVFRAIIFPRTQHRPKAYYAVDPERRMLLSPGAADMSGIVVMPIEEQFRRIAAQDLSDMYAQTCATPEMMTQLLRGCKFSP